MPPEPLHILHIITGTQVGGAEVMLCRVLEQMDRSRFRASVICLGPRGPMADRMEASGFALTILNLGGPATFPGGLLRLVKHLRAQRPAVVQTWLYHADFLGGLASVFAGRPPVMWSIHHTSHAAGGVKRSTRAIMWMLARMSGWLPARILCCAHASAAEHARHGYCARKMEVIPNGADIDAFAPDAVAAAAARNEFGIPQDALVAGTAGRFHPLKDYPNFFAAVLEMQAQRPEMHFIACGAGVTAENPEIAPWLARSSRPERIHLPGMRSDIAKIYPAMDVYLLSSESEGWPLGLSEAMACGVPAAATDVGDARDILGNAGVIVPVKNPQALAAGALQILALPPEERQALRREARDSITGRFSLEGIVRRYESAWAELSGCSDAPVTDAPEAAGFRAGHVHGERTVEAGGRGRA